MAERYKGYWGDEGGITVSGGEPLLQIDFLLELFIKAKQRGINTCIDTALQPFTREEPFFSEFTELMEVTDLFILDIKEIDDEKHKSLTGHTNANILDMARFLSDSGKHMWIRNVLVPTVTDDEGDLRSLAAFIDTLETVDRVEVLPYHTLGLYKYEKLGIQYSLEGIEPPTKEQTAFAESILKR